MNEPTVEPKQRWFSKETPLWLPNGSVRAFLVLGLTFAVIIIMVKFAAYKQEIPKSVESIMQSLIPAIVLLIREYIANRREEEKAKAVTSKQVTVEQHVQDPPAITEERKVD